MTKDEIIVLLKEQLQLAKSFKRIYADSDVFWTKEQIKKQGWEILKNEETEAQKTDETKTLAVKV